MIPQKVELKQELEMTWFFIKLTRKNRDIHHELSIIYQNWSSLIQYKEILKDFTSFRSFTAPHINIKTIGNKN